MLSKSVAEFGCGFFSLLVRENSAAEFDKQKITQNHILGLDLFQFYEGYIYYKYRPCIRVNLEIEGAETRF